MLTASFRFHLTIDTLAVQLYTSLLPRRIRDFHPLERAHGAQTKKAKDIYTLCERGYADKILLSHDGLTFNGFHTNACIREDNPYEPIFSYLIPEMCKIGFTQNEIETFITQNPKNMLLCKCLRRYEHV